MGTLDDAMAGAMKGASLGSIVPGVGTAIGAGVGGLAGIVLGMMPDADAATAAKVVSTVQTIAGNDPAALADPQVQADLKTALAGIAADRQAQRDAATEQARQVMLSLERDHSPLAWGAAVVSLLVVGGFGVVSTLMLVLPVPDGSMPLALGVMETLKMLTVSVVGYWCGSSYGSARKTTALVRMAASS